VRLTYIEGEKLAERLRQGRALKAQDSVSTPTAQAKAHTQTSGRGKTIKEGESITLSPRLYLLPWYYLPQLLAAAVNAAWIRLSCCPPIPVGGLE